jgi:hypothetical protein
LVLAINTAKPVPITGVVGAAQIFGRERRAIIGIMKNEESVSIKTTCTVPNQNIIVPATTVTIKGTVLQTSMYFQQGTKTTIEFVNGAPPVLAANTPLPVVLVEPAYPMQSVLVVPKDNTKQLHS